MNPESEAAPAPAGGEAAGTKFNCPTCGAPLYSERTRLCDHCGAALPPEMVLTDEKAEARDEERQWARDLADKFDTTGRAPKPVSPHNGPMATNVAAAELAAKLRRISCASEFKYRPRPAWLYATGWALTLLAQGIPLWIMSRAFHMDLTPLLKIWLLISAWISFKWYALWRRAMPICPNCHQNICICPADYCHVCGEPLSHKRCADCGVNHSWTGLFRPFENGSSQLIAYCPGCGVELDTRISRWRPGER